MVDEQWLFLIVALKGDILTQIRHTFNVFHPELIDRCEVDLSGTDLIATFEEFLYFCEFLSLLYFEDCLFCFVEINSFYRDRMKHDIAHTV